MREPITTAPRDGSSIILEDDASGTYDVARWSPEAGTWIGENEEPSKITPSHWLPMPGETYSLREEEARGRPRPRAPRRKLNSFLPFAKNRTAPRQPETGGPVAVRPATPPSGRADARLEARAPPGQAEFRSWTRPGFAILTVASLVVASSAATYFHDETAAFLTKYPGLQDPFREASRLASEDLRQSNASPSQPQSKADQASIETPAEGNGQMRRATPVLTGASQSPQGEQRSPSLANELAEARRSVDGLRLQLQTEAATAKQSLDMEREKTAALELQAKAARQELTASDEQHRRALDEEQARSAALASELATTRSEIEKQVALSRKAGEEAARQRQAVEGAVAEVRQSLDQEREKTATLAKDADALRKRTASDEQHRRALDEERARSAALASELATTRSEIEKQVALSRKAGEEAARQRQAVEGKVAEVRQSLQQEREKTAALDREASAARQAMIADAEQNRRAHDEMRARNAALAGELAAARSEIEKQVGLSRRAGEEAVRQRRAVEGTVAELRQSLDQEREKAVALAKDADALRKSTAANGEQHRRALDEARAGSAALASELATARHEIETQAALSRKTGDQVAPQRLDAERTIVELQQPLKQERNATEPVARDRQASRRTTDGNVTVGLPADVQINPVTQAANAPAPTLRAATDAQDNAEATRLMARASALLAQGNISAARIVLERAAETGSALASFMLAETYDPDILSAWGTYGTRGEAAKARELYAQAQSGGIHEAKARLETLRQ